MSVNEDILHTAPPICSKMSPFSDFVRETPLTERVPDRPLKNRKNRDIENGVLTPRKAWCAVCNDMQQCAAKWNDNQTVDG